MSDRTGVYTSERGDAIQCRSGRPWHVLDPRPEDVRLGDVVRSLARNGRYRLLCVLLGVRECPE